MASLVAYTDSECSSEDDLDEQKVQHVSSTNTSESSTVANPKKRSFSELAIEETNDVTATTSSSDITRVHPTTKKRKRIKLMPSAKAALFAKTSTASSIIDIGIEAKHKKDQKVEALMSKQQKSLPSAAQETTQSTAQQSDAKYQAELKRNRIENAKYVKQQLNLLNQANKETKLKKMTQETTRQKNNRKQKLGQANFSLKWDRDCGFEMAGV